MTRDDITELRGLAEDHYWTDGDRDDLRRLLPRLLAERDALLTALKIEPHCCGQAQVKEHHKIRAAAIRLAES